MSDAAYTTGWRFLERSHDGSDRRARPPGEPLRGRAEACMPAPGSPANRFSRQAWTTSLAVLRSMGCSCIPPECAKSG